MISGTRAESPGTKMSCFIKVRLALRNSDNNSENIKNYFLRAPGTEHSSGGVDFHQSLVAGDARLGIMTQFRMYILRCRKLRFRRTKSSFERQQMLLSLAHQPRSKFDRRLG